LDATKLNKMQYASDLAIVIIALMAVLTFILTFMVRKKRK